MPTLIDRLRHGADNIHSIGAGRAADLIREAAAAIEELQRAQSVASEPVVTLPPAVHAKLEAWIRETLKGPPDPSWKTAPFKCSCPRGCEDRLEMRIFHGTPEQFIAALSNASDNLSAAERELAAARYCDDWAAAPEGPRELTMVLHAQLRAMGCDVHSATQSEFKRAWEWVEKWLSGPRAVGYLKAHNEHGASFERAMSFGGIAEIHGWDMARLTKEQVVHIHRIVNHLTVMPIGRREWQGYIMGQADSRLIVAAEAQPSASAEVVRRIAELRARGEWVWSDILAARPKGQVRLVGDPALIKALGLEAAGCIEPEE